MDIHPDKTKTVTRAYLFNYLYGKQLFNLYRGHWRTARGGFYGHGDHRRRHSDQGVDEGTKEAGPTSERRSFMEFKAWM